MTQQQGAARQTTLRDQQLADDAETADYIADLLRQLEKLAHSGGLVRLAYLLRECVEEAERAAKG